LRVLREKRNKCIGQYRLDGGTEGSDKKMSS